jgi:uncharacterized protein
MNFGLKEETINKINSVFIKYQEVEEVIIYGSRAKGNYRDGSDIDLTIRSNNITEKILSKIKYDIEELNTPYLFDISLFSALSSSELKEHILRAGKIFYSKRKISEL